MLLRGSVAGLLWAAGVIVGLAAGCNEADDTPSRRSAASSSAVPSSGTGGSGETRPPPRLVQVTPEEIGPLLRGQGGRALMVNVWSTWCKPCIDEFPELLEVARSYESRGLRTLFISADPASQHDEALQFLVDQKAPMPGYVKVGSDTAFIEALNPGWSGSLPATMLFDADRDLMAHWEEPVNRATLSGPVERLLRTGATDGQREAP